MVSAQHVITSLSFGRERQVELYVEGRVAGSSGQVGGDAHWGASTEGVRLDNGFGACVELVASGADGSSCGRERGGVDVGRLGAQPERHDLAVEVCVGRRPGFVAVEIRRRGQRRRWRRFSRCTRWDRRGPSVGAPVPEASSSVITNTSLSRHGAPTAAGCRECRLVRSAVQQLLGQGDAAFGDGRVRLAGDLRRG